MQLLPVAKRCLMTSILSGVKAEPPSAALSGLSAIWPLNPGLAPWAVLLDPFGVLGFAPETRLQGKTPYSHTDAFLVQMLWGYPCLSFDAATGKTATLPVSLYADAADQ